MPTDLSTLLIFLAGGTAAAGLAPLLEKSENFKALDSQVKVALVIALNTIISVAALAAIEFVPKETVDALNPFVAVGLNAFYIGVNQFAYLVSKKSDDKPVETVK